MDRDERTPPRHVPSSSPDDDGEGVYPARPYPGQEKDAEYLRQYAEMMAAIASKLPAGAAHPPD